MLECWWWSCGFGIVSKVLVEWENIGLFILMSKINSLLSIVMFFVGFEGFMFVFLVCRVCLWRMRFMVYVLMEFFLRLFRFRFLYFVKVFFIVWFIFCVIIFLNLWKCGFKIFSLIV